MTYTPTNWVDGSTPLNRTNMMRIENELALLDTGKADAAALGTWQSYSPSFNGTLAPGTLIGRYCQIGKLVHFYARLLIGSGTNTTGGNPFSIGLPTTIGGGLGAGAYFPVGAGYFYESAGAGFATTILQASVGMNTFNTFTRGLTTWTLVQLGMTAPVTFTPNSELNFWGSYESV